MLRIVVSFDARRKVQLDEMHAKVRGEKNTEIRETWFFHGYNFCFHEFASFDGTGSSP